MVGPPDWRDAADAEWRGNRPQPDWSKVMESRGAAEPRRTLRLFLPFPDTEGQPYEVMLKATNGGVEVSLVEHTEEPNDPDYLEATER